MEESRDRQPQRLPIKLYRTADLVTVAAPMPGLGPGDVAIVVSPERRLVIVGRLCADSDENCGTLKAPHKEVLLDEWQVGPYRREIELPTDVDGERATVTYGNGILVIALPVAATTRPARLTLDHVDTHVRGARVGDPNGDDRASPRPSDNPVDEASWESFPASDPPSFTGSRARAFD